MKMNKKQFNREVLRVFLSGKRASQTHVGIGIFQTYSENWLLVTGTGYWLLGTGCWVLVTGGCYLQPGFTVMATY